VITLEPAAGPSDPPSSRPRAGVLGGTVFRYRFRPADGVTRVPAPGFESVVCAPDTVLHWAFYADGDAAVRAPWAPLAVTVDAVAVDAVAGAVRLSGDGRVRDRYGFSIDPAAQFAAAWSMPEQWNADTVSLAPFAGRTARVEVVLGVAEFGPLELSEAQMPAEVTGFIELWVEAKPPAPRTPAERVDTRRGSHAGARFSRGNTIPAVAVPHGFTFLTPATDARDQRWPYRPFVHDDDRGRRLEAIQFSHQPSPWIGDRGVLQVMPFDGIPRSDPAQRRRWFDPTTERAHPHGWAAVLDGGLAVDATATGHVGLFRVRATRADAEVGFVIDQPGRHGALTATGERVHGWVGEADARDGNGGRTFFAGIVRTASGRGGALDDDGRADRAGFVAGRGELELRIAVSFVSLAQAWRALDQEAPATLSFDEVRARTHTAWNSVLDRVRIPDLPASDRPFRGLAHDDSRAQLASALYRLHLYPNAGHENAGTVDQPEPVYADPFAPAAAHGVEITGAPVVSGRLAVNNGYWDTCRTAWPLMNLIDPVRARGLLDGILEQQRRSGWMPRWSAPGYVDSMVGTSSDQIFADGERWGLLDDPAAAFASGWRNACERAPDARRGRKGIGRGRFRGFISRDTHEGMSWSIENAISDAALGRLAARLAQRAEGAERASADAFARYFANRSRSYRQLFDTEHGFFRGRTARGARPREAFDPRTWGGDYVETNAWGMSVSAVHDAAALAELYGGPAGLRRHLDRLFTEPETADPSFAGSYGTVIHEQREARALRSGMCAISNQPAHHIPYMYTATDEPWRAGATVHALARRLFSGGHIGQGFPGDEDNGEMSAWWLWAALGLYPLEVASGALVIGSPLFDDITIDRSDGSRLRIRTRRAAPDAHVLRTVRLNGMPWHEPVLPVDVFRSDVELELEFGDTPGELWATNAPAATIEAWHPDLTSGAGRRIRARGVWWAGRLFDDGAAWGDHGTLLRAGAWAGWVFPEPTRVTDVTVTVVDAAGAGALRWETSDDGSSWSEVSVTAPQALLPDRTTPFRFAEPVTACFVRVQAMDAVRLRQLELLDLDDPVPS